LPTTSIKNIWIFVKKNSLVKLQKTIKKVIDLFDPDKPRGASPLRQFLRVGWKEVGERGSG